MKRWNWIHHSSIDTDTLYTLVMIFSGNEMLIIFLSSEVSLSCNRKTARILRVPCTANVEPERFIRKHSLLFGSCLNIWEEKVYGCFLPQRAFCLLRFKICTSITQKAIFKFLNLTQQFSLFQTQFCFAGDVKFKIICFAFEKQSLHSLVIVSLLRSCWAVWISHFYYHSPCKLVDKLWYLFSSIQEHFFQEYEHKLK